MKCHRLCEQMMCKATALSLSYVIVVAEGLMRLSANTPVLMHTADVCAHKAARQVLRCLHTESYARLESEYHIDHAAPTWNHHSKGRYDICG